MVAGRVESSFQGNIEADSLSDITMTVDDLIQRAINGQHIEFEQTIAVIEQHYQYRPTAFANGVGVEKIINHPGSNEGSCKIFAFARLHQLTPDQTLALFGDYYHLEVLENPDGSNHKNIRNFMKFGWDSLIMDGLALTPLR